MQHGRLWRRIKHYTACGNVPFNLSFAFRYSVVSLSFSYGIGLQDAPAMITLGAQNGANALDWRWTISFKIGVVQFHGFFEAFPALIEPTNLWELALADQFGSTMGAIWSQEALIHPTDGMWETVPTQGPISFQHNGDFHAVVPQWTIVPVHYHDEP